MGVEADWQPSNGRPGGTYFSFEASKWNDVFGQSVENGATTKNVEQWRNGQMVWNRAIFKTVISSLRGRSDLSGSRSWRTGSTPTAGQRALTFLSRDPIGGMSLAHGQSTGL